MANVYIEEYNCEDSLKKIKMYFHNNRQKSVIFHRVL